VAIAIAIALVVLSVLPVVASAHDVSANTENSELLVPFGVAIGLSVLLCLAIGLVTVAYCQPNRAVEHRHVLSPRIDVIVLLIVLGLVALLSAVTQQWALTVVGGLLGGVVAWFGRARGVSPHTGCADTAFGAILAHRTVEGILVASIYAASAALGFVGLTVLTIHAIAETIAIGGLYAPIGRGWGIASVIALQLSFIAGILSGDYFMEILSTSITTILLAGVGGALFIAGATEFHMVASRRQEHLEA
jgi:hypothetical protein